MMTYFNISNMYDAINYATIVDRKNFMRISKRYLQLQKLIQYTLLVRDLYGLNEPA